ncbi:MAG TPA: hypothetical protein VK563_06735 [Puia sp.]|nr:hypothetical protein [Puia sp.]
MKEFFVLCYSLIIGASSFPDNTRNINEKLIQSFKESFPDAQQVAWEELSETYVVNFVDDGVRNNIIYMKDGTFLRSIRYYQERTLPYYLLVNIKKKYAGKKIYSVTEMSTISHIEYYIKLEDAKVLITIRVDGDGNLDMVEKYRKAS